MHTGKVVFRIIMSYKFSILLFLILNTSCALQKPASAQRNNVSMQVFYDHLSPYGEWVDYPDYGYVWVPDVDQNFEPYSSAGHWVMTDYGWTWISDYDWGWAPFHYGRWDYDDYYGWFWVPDTEWGPSWVTWRRANGYYGWTPMRPGISISLSFYGGYGDMNRWNFVRDRDFGRSDINHYYVDRSDYNVIIQKSTVINNTYIDNSRHTTYIAGPTGGDVQKYTGRQINNFKIRNIDRPGEKLNKNQLEIYRPQVQRNEGSQKSAPSRITDKTDVKPVRERNDATQKINTYSRQRQQQQQQQKKQQPQQQEQGRQQEQRQQQQEQVKQQDQVKQHRKQQQQQDQVKEQQQRQQQQEQVKKQQEQPPQRQLQRQQQQEQVKQQDQVHQQRQRQQLQQQQQQEQVKPQQQAQPTQPQQQPQQQKAANPNENKRKARQQKAVEPTKEQN
jgi:hypothetical protein